MASLKTNLKTKKFYNYGTTEECNGETVLSPSEFAIIFQNIGAPDIPLDKTGAPKKSKVITYLKCTAEENTTVFGKLLENITVDTYNRPYNFQKQFKTGKAEVDVRGSTLQYSSNTQTLKMKFTCKSKGMGGFTLRDEGGDY